MRTLKTRRIGVGYNRYLVTTQDGEQVGLAKIERYDRMSGSGVEWWVACACGCGDTDCEPFQTKRDALSFLMHCEVFPEIHKMRV